MAETDAFNDPQLYFAEDGAPRSGRFGDIYYSLQDGLSETRAVFLEGCHLPQGWCDGGHFSVLELGFGTGLNIVALMQLWSQTRPPSGHLHIFSIEGFLMRREEAQGALRHWPELAPFSDALLAQWPAARKGFHYIDLPQWGISLTLALMDVRDAMAAWDGQADAIFLDGFSPALNPDMWADDVFQSIAQHAKPGARLGTFTVAGFVRRGLQTAGFAVEKRPGFGRKRERLEAIFPADGGASAQAPTQKIAIVGAGIAGCAVLYQARLLGIDADIFDAEGPGSGASGNAAALVTPRLDAGDNDISALFADAFAYATGFYRRGSPQAVLGEGVHQCEMGPKDASRFARIKEQTGFTRDDLSLFSAGQVADLPKAAGITIRTALWIKPEDVLASLLEGQEVIIEKLAGRVQSDGGKTELIMASGKRYGGYDAVILTCGEGIFDVDDYHARYDLRPVRGQVEIMSTDAPLRDALSWGGYAIPLEKGFIFGATHEREDRGIESRDSDRTRNLDTLAKVMPERAEAARATQLTSRASVRVMTRDYLPVVGEIAPGVHAVTGLGARGFCLAPLLAKAVLTQILRAPSPLPVIAKSLLSPVRLTRR